MSHTKTITARIAVQGSPAEVFNAVTDWEAQSKWIFATKVRGVSGESRRLGGKLEAFTGIGVFGFLDTMEITKWHPPHLCEVTHTGSIVKGSGLFEVAAENGTTYFIWTERTNVPFGIVGRISWVIAGPLTALGLRYSLRRFKKLCEQGPR